MFADSALNVGIASSAAGAIELCLNIAVLILVIVALGEPIHWKIKKVSDHDYTSISTMPSDCINCNANFSASVSRTRQPHRSDARWRTIIGVPCQDMDALFVRHFTDGSILAPVVLS
jgi:hypothetical protein